MILALKGRVRVGKHQDCTERCNIVQYISKYHLRLTRTVSRGLYEFDLLVCFVADIANVGTGGWPFP